MITNAGHQYKLKSFAGQLHASGFVLRLFQNDYDPIVPSSLEDFEEADFYGYSPVTIMPDDWDIVDRHMKVSDKIFTSSQDQTPQDIFGFFIQVVDTGEVIIAERFQDGPYTIERRSQFVQVTSLVY